MAAVRATAEPPPPANLEPYVRVLGTDGAIRFLDAFGGAELSIGKRSQARSRLVQLVGRDKADQLAAIAERLPARVPLGKRWVAAVLAARGLPVAEIARRLRASDVAVRGWLSGKGPAPGSYGRDAAQLKLL